MKTINKLTMITCVIVMFLALSHSAFAYPPDNAALIYYQACLMYQPDEHMWDLLADCARGDIELTEEIINHIKEQNQIIEMIVVAADVPCCDWGMDYSKGVDMPIPALGKMKRLAVLVLSDARMLAEKGDYDQALQRCLTIYKMARHVSDRTLICWLLGIAMDVKTDRCVQFILSKMPQDLETLTCLKNKLAVIESFPRFKSCMDYELGLANFYMQMENKDKFISLIRMEIEYGGYDILKSMKEDLCDADQEYFDKALVYHEAVKSNVLSALDLPYPQAYDRLIETVKKPQEDLESGMNEAVLTAMHTPALAKAYTLGIRGKTNFNAVRVALEIYIIKAETGKLPDTIGAGLPKDLFSGKDFEYEKTADGFILRCQGKELPKDRLHEWEFKVAK